MDRKQALNILQLEHNCSEKQIKDKYGIFLLRAKKEDDINIQDVTDAYNFLLGFETYEKLDEDSKSYKFRRFLFNKLSYILIFSGFLALILYFIIPKLTEVEVDLSVTFVGNYYLLEAEELETLLYETVEDSEKVIVEMIYVDKDTSDATVDEAGRVRLAGTIISKEADIFIEDDENFIFLVTYDVLMPLDDIIPLLDIEVDPSRYIYGVDENGVKKIYGINVGENKMLLQTAFGNIIRIFSIAKETEHFDQVIQASNVILKED